MRRLRTVVLSISLTALLFAPFAVFAQDADTPTSEIVDIEEVNSFELFWPMVAGKTMDDGIIYSIKRLKEKVRGWFIFGKIQKANYGVFLGTKRVLEAEKLLKEDKKDLVIKSLDLAITHFKSSQENIERAREKDSSATIDLQARSRLQNLDKLVSWLAADREDVKSELGLVEEVVSQTLKNVP